MAGSESEDKRSDGKKADTSKWWEVYAVRYFVGTIIGGIVVFILSAQSESSLREVFTFKVGTELNAQVVSMLAALGLAICYISSAPILVLHATRGAYIRRDAHRFNVVLFSMVAFAIVGSCVVAWLFKLSQLQCFSVLLLWL